MLKPAFQSCRIFLVFLTIILAVTAHADTGPAKRDFYEMKIYHFKDSLQERTIDNYLQSAFLPALHRAGVPKIGVFKVIGNDTLADKRLYVFIPLRSLDQLLKLEEQLMADALYQASGKEYLDAGYKTPPYTRIESIILHAFRLAPKLQLPALQSPLKEHIYELRSYESATEKLYNNKVKMFNEGGEIDLFKRLGFNAVFYAEVISGSHMPNLMYMTSFENKEARDAHWKQFGQDPEWKKLSSMSEYQNNVSRNDMLFLRAAEYSDF